eukprot:scaffold597_cov176-Amphora_coffeaeformis.AAC.28
MGLFRDCVTWRESKMFDARVEMGHFCNYGTWRESKMFDARVEMGHFRDDVARVQNVRRESENGSFSLAGMVGPGLGCLARVRNVRGESGNGSFSLGRGPRQSHLERIQPE